MTLPGLLLWGGVLFLLWRLTEAARRYGPLSLRVAAVMRLLSWFILIGSVAAASLQGFATDALLDSMLRARNDFGDSIPQPSTLVVPLIAAVALLRFARYIRLGVADEIDGTAL